MVTSKKFRDKALAAGLAVGLGVSGSAFASGATDVTGQFKVPTHSSSSKLNVHGTNGSAQLQKAKLGDDKGIMDLVVPVKNGEPSLEILNANSNVRTMLDTNNDGKVSFSEGREYFLKHGCFAPRDGKVVFRIDNSNGTILGHEYSYPYNTHKVNGREIGCSVPRKHHPKGGNGGQLPSAFPSSISNGEYLVPNLFPSGIFDQSPSEVRKLKDGSLKYVPVDYIDKRGTPITINSSSFSGHLRNEGDLAKRVLEAFGNQGIESLIGVTRDAIEVNAIRERKGETPYGTAFDAILTGASRFDGLVHNDCKDAKETCFTPSEFGNIVAKAAFYGDVAKLGAQELASKWKANSWADTLKTEPATSYILPGDDYYFQKKTFYTGGTLPDSLIAKFDDVTTSCVEPYFGKKNNSHFNAKTAVSCIGKEISTIVSKQYVGGNK